MKTFRLIFFVLVAALAFALGGPTNLHVVGTPTKTQVSLAWNACAATGDEYDIWREEKSNEQVMVGKTSSQKFVDSTLVSGTTYTYVVVCRDPQSNRISDASNKLVVTAP
jgi:chitodextrinase